MSFWIRWLLEEDALLRKETKGSLTAVNRTFGKGKGKHDVGDFIVALYIEIYNEEIRDLLSDDVK